MTSSTLSPPSSSPGPDGPVQPSATGPLRAFTRRFARPSSQPAWVRPLLGVLLLSTAALYLVGLTKSGEANDFYAASVKSATENLKAWLFASLDSGNAITVDKPPASIWLMGLSGRIFGFSSFSMLLPQALLGIGTVAVTYSAVRRWSGDAAGLVAGALLALTPVAALMFRFNNPDALLVFLMTLAAYFVIRALDTPVARRAVIWLALAGVALGIAFLTKMLQGLLVLPAFALAYLWAARFGVWQRIRHLLVAAGALLVSAGWFVALVELWPASSRPFIGGSTDNSLLQLAIGYNGLSRIFGNNSRAGARPTTGGGGFGGSTGLTRLFGSEFGTQISWLLPAALLILVAGLWFSRRLPRTDHSRAALILWGGAMVVTALVFSYMSGTIHPYYTVALAPFISGTVAVGVRELWRGRANHWVRGVLAAAIALTAVWSWELLRLDAPNWLPGLRVAMLMGGLAGAALLAVPPEWNRRLAAIGLIGGSVFALSGTAAFTVVTASQGHTGSIPTAGPASSSGRGFGGGGGTGTANSALVTLLNATTTRWSAAVSSSMTASPLILASHTAVMAIGGFSGSDPSPTLAEFKRYVADGDISYYVAGGRGGGGSSSIQAWVEQNFSAQTVGGSTVYDLRSGNTG